MVFTPVIHLTTQITTHLPTPHGWKVELVWLFEPWQSLPTKLLHVNRRSGEDLGIPKFEPLSNTAKREPCHQHKVKM